MIFKYCAECGTKLEEIRCGDDDCKICPACKKIYGSSPVPVIGALVVNEFHEILLLKQDYISTKKWTIVTGYMTDGENAEESVVREVKEETGQNVLKCRYVSSYYYEPKQLIMLGFIVSVRKSAFTKSAEVNALKWYRLEEVDAVIARENNYSGILFDNCRTMLEKGEW